MGHLVDPRIILVVLRFPYTSDEEEEERYEDTDTA